ncbi:MAG: 4-(cytidine 5'-diphospho)-2-C-methyl-D-erythritol kinase [Eubacteriales bacterium]|nr:4-(cytidine 5'-diphospho)-2-C-methyl-D-erythritol kinase [Eubacteriales bacterium]
MEYQELKAYAKINLILNVLGKRPDGYHEVETVMQAVDLCDRIQTGWEPCPAGLPPYASPCEAFPGELAVDVRTSAPLLPTGPENLAYQAALLMHERFHRGLCERITVDIEKKIPVAAGLAGGSADGAAVLWALAGLWALPAQAFDPLLELAAQLGSDVPFCLMVHKGITACLATGRGTELQPVEPLDCKVLITTPDISVSTGDVYQALTPEDRAQPFDLKALLEAAPKDVAKAAACMGNHLQAPALRLFPEIQKSIDWVRSLYNPLTVFVSGSGPSVVGVYPNGSPMESTCVCHGLNPSNQFVSTLQ